MTLALSRRELLKFGAASGGLLVTCRLGLAASYTPPAPPSAFIRIAPDNRITLLMPRVEMGQGIFTCFAMLLAEELEVGLDQVEPEPAPPHAAYYRDSINFEQVTGGSASTRAWYDPLRQAGATARVLLIAAAAREWGADPATCRAERAEVIHEPSGRRLTYGAVAAKAAALRPPKSVPLKKPEQWRLIGRATQRLDLADKVTGRTRFGIDVHLPGMLVATVAACPVFGGRLKRVDDTKVKAVKGVRKVVRLSDAVAVVAEHMGAARKGLERLAIEWDEGPGAADSSEKIRKAMQAGLARSGVVAVRSGNTAKALQHAAKVVEADYELPLLAHGSLEPINCTVHVRKDGVDVWTGTQSPVRAQEIAAHAAGVPVSKVNLHNTMIGGGFGRRLYVDHVGQAVLIAREFDVPVKVVWTREEDMRHDHYRPTYLDHLAAGLDGEGRPVAWTHRVCCSAVSLYWSILDMNGPLDTDACDPAAGAYTFPNVLTDWVRVEPGHVPTGWWRGVGPTHNCFMVECFVDELAHAAGADPVAFRRPLLAGNQRMLAVLDLVAVKSGWTARPPAGKGRGISLVWSPTFGDTFLAMVAEVAVDSAGNLRVERVVCAVDCGRPINPDAIRAQVEGGVVFGLTAALYGEITVAKGRIVQSNFDDYKLLRIDEAPAVEVHIVASDAPPSGLGEPPTAAIGPAVANAVFAATGKRVRRLPITPALLTAS